MKQITSRSLTDNFHMIRSCLSLAIVSASLLMGCGDSDSASARPQGASGTTQKEPAAQPSGAFEEDPSCPVELPQGVSARCGKLLVPEDYSRPSARKVQLQVAIFEST